MGRRVGLYDELITLGLARELEELERSGFLIFKDELDAADADVKLSRHLAMLLTKALRSVESDQRLEKQVRLANALREALSRLSSKEVSSEDTVSRPPQILSAISPRSIGLASHQAPQRPQIRLSASDLLVNARGEPRIGHSLAEEIPSCDRIDLLCAFIRWNGLRIVEPALREFLEGRRPLRVITTTYTGSTERRALDRLADMGAEVKVSYETQATRLHAKAWLFQRDTGYSTAYVGSSNLSQTAMLDGLEWNVRLSEVETPALLEKFRATFESYWADPSSEEYRPERDAERFDDAVRSGASRALSAFHRAGRESLSAPGGDSGAAGYREGTPRSPPESGRRGNRDGEDGRSGSRLQAAGIRWVTANSPLRRASEGDPRAEPSDISRRS